MHENEQVSWQSLSGCLFSFQLFVANVYWRVGYLTDSLHMEDPTT